MTGVLQQVLHQLVDGWRPPAYAALKALAMFVTAAAAFRCTGRRTIAQFTPFDWVTAVAIGAIVGRTATSAGTSWITGSAAMLTLIAAHDVVARLRFNPSIRRLVDPPVRVLIRNGQINERNLKRSRLTHADLGAILREHGHRSPSDVRLALFESEGAVSIFPNKESRGELLRADEGGPL